MNVRWLVAAAVLNASACLPKEGPCQGGGERTEGLCNCPDDMPQQVDAECVDLPDASRAALEAADAGEGTATVSESTR